MALISFIPLNKKNIILFFFISISVITCVIPACLELIKPFEIDLIDYSSQILIGIPFLFQHLCTKNKKHKLFSHFSKLDYIIFVLIMIIDLIQATMYVIYDDTLFYASNTFNRYNFDMILLEIFSKFTSNSRYFIHHVIGQIFYLALLILHIF